jgi:5-methylcytosine-specific restriction endonuclease McrA
MPRVYIAAETQRTVIERAYNCCEYCQSRADYATASFAVEHIVPISRGGPSDLSNLALSCSGIIGVTPTGRATVEALRLNRPGLVNMRQVLYGIGKHPPDRPEA